MEKKYKGVRTVIQKGTMTTVVNDDGEVIDGLELSKYKQIDSLLFTKVYIKDTASALNEISYPACQMILYVMLHVERKTNSVYLAYKDVKSIFGNIGLTSYYKGVKELITRNVIEPTRRRNTYYVNPNMIFNGVRISKFK